MYNVTLRHVRESLLPWKSNKYYIFVCACACKSVCRHVALLIQYANRMHHIVMSFVAPLAPQFFNIIS